MIGLQSVQFSSFQGLSHVQLFATLWTVARQAPLLMGFCRQEYWSGLPFPSLGDLPKPGVETASLASPVLAGGFFTTSTTWEAHRVPHHILPVSGLAACIDGSSCHPGGGILVTPGRSPCPSTSTLCTLATPLGSQSGFPSLTQEHNSFFFFP